MKAARAALDFDDLILKTRDLLQSEGGAGWALYKLDQAIDHILVDEAQDTNPEQWDIVRALTGEFFQPDAALRRTVFAVGDPKQSIFSFQRADPAEFHKSQAQFRAASEAASLPFAQVPLEVSFRSVPAVLQAVDATFAEAPALDGLSPDGAPPRHSADRAGTWPDRLGAGVLRSATLHSDPSSVSDPATVVQRQLEAYNRKDVDALIELYAGAAELLEQTGTVLARGSAVLCARFAARFQKPNLHAALLHRAVCAFMVVDHELGARTSPEYQGSIELVIDR